MGPRTERDVGAVSFGHWKTTTFVAAFRFEGLVAPMVIDAALNGDLFRAYVRQQLAARPRPGDVVAMDNLATLEVAGVAEATRPRDAELVYLPGVQPGPQPGRAGILEGQERAPPARVANGG